MLSRCAGTCDTDLNRCVCGAGARFPERAMQGCQYEGVERDMAWQTPAWGGFARGARAAFWRKDASAAPSTRAGVAPWCDADLALQQRPAARCSCYEKTDGHCAPVARHFCVNQCSGRGPPRAAG